MTTDPEVTAGHSIGWTGIGAWTGMVVKNDPGQPIIWLAFGFLIAGIVLTFYFPRRRAWARIEAGEVRLAFLADRYVDGGRRVPAARRGGGGRGERWRRPAHLTPPRPATYRWDRIVRRPAPERNRRATDPLGIGP